MSDHTPLMSQYRDIKSNYNDCILLFRVGDFYETFYDDAVDVSGILNIALTTRDKNKANPIPLAGVPFHAAENYVTRLLAAGRKVAVCEQVEDPALAKGLVRREVVEVLTPGTAMNSQLLTDDENNYCLAVAVRPDSDEMGIAMLDVSTGEFHCGAGAADDAVRLLQGKSVREVVIARSTDRDRVDALIRRLGRPYVVELPDEDFTPDVARGAIARQFDGGRDDLSPGETVAVGALLRHCYRLRDRVLPQVVALERMGEDSFLTLDDETIANLELFEPLRGGVARATLIHTLDHTLSAMGGREIRRWMQQPLCNVAAIEARLEALAALHGDAERLELVMQALKGIGDIPRLASRIASRKAIPRECHGLRESLEKLPALRAALAGAPAEALVGACDALGDHGALCATIARAVVDDPPGHLRDGGVIRKGFDAELDALIDESEGARGWIAGLEKRERERTGIGSLKVGYNKVFGYYIEVSKANLASVPEDYVQKQTLVSAQRYYTQELKEREESILAAEEKRVAREQIVFDSLCETIALQAAALQRAALGVATIDVVHALAVAARLYGYRPPVVDDSRVLDIRAGRHPVLERIVSEAFVPNDLQLEPERRQFALITGPNMSGKSTFLRQTALVVLMAQMGSFVPAERARIGLVDRIFTRVGASDRLSRGESTFLVEMNETALILDHMTDRSLVVLDEIGRGTSTYDGLSIAWAVTEYLLQGVRARPRAMFATHFHELTQLRASYPRLVNLKISIREWEGGIVFLRKIVPGTSDRSFGIHAARIAGLPAPVLKRAEEILHSLELRRNLLTQGVDIAPGRDQMSLFSSPETTAPANEDSPSTGDIADAIAGFDLDRSTPLDALQFVRSLKDKLSDR